MTLVNILLLGLAQVIRRFIYLGTIYVQEGKIKYPYVMGIAALVPSGTSDRHWPDC